MIQNSVYAPAHPEKINNLTQIQLKLKKNIEYNNYLTNVVLKNLSQGITDHLRTQNEMLKIANALNDSLLYRKEQRYKDALDSLEQALILVETNKYTLSENMNNYKTYNEILSLVYYQKGKVHRMMAGRDLSNLKQPELKLCEENYKSALALSPDNHAIHSSLGFLYNDMGKVEDAKKEMELAQSLHPEFPEYLHGVAYTYYKIEEGKPEKRLVLSQDNLNQSKEIFRGLFNYLINSIRLTVESIWIMESYYY